MDCTHQCRSIRGCSQFAYCEHGSHHRCYLKRPFDTPETGCLNRKRAEGCTWVAERPDTSPTSNPTTAPSVPKPTPRTPSPPSVPQSSFYKFRVKNCFWFGCSNSNKAQSAARNAARSLRAEISWMDDTDTSVTGFTGFVLKVGLSIAVDQLEFTMKFNEACQGEGLKWGQSADIFEDSTCIAKGRACPPDWDCASNPSCVAEVDHCCGGSACTTTRHGQNPGVCG